MAFSRSASDGGVVLSDQLAPLNVDITDPAILTMREDTMVAIQSNVMTFEQMRQSRIADACEILRAHGINAYALDDNVTLYARRQDLWDPVMKFPNASVPYTLPMMTAQQIAEHLAHRVADLCSGPHTHDVRP